MNHNVSDLVLYYPACPADDFPGAALTLSTVGTGAIGIDLQATPDEDTPNVPGDWVGVQEEEAGALKMFRWLGEVLLPEVERCQENPFIVFRCGLATVRYIWVEGEFRLYGCHGTGTPLEFAGCLLAAADYVAEVEASQAETQTYQLPDGRTVTVTHPYYLASCDGCGWVGSSQECGSDSGLRDDSDIYCPVCHQRGADSGKVAAEAEEVARG